MAGPLGPEGDGSETGLQGHIVYYIPFQIVLDTPGAPGGKTSL